MKVCTDSVLFGAMMPVKPNDAALDIGTGAGLLALIAAQLGAGRVTAVEISGEACREAERNFQGSPWADRLRAVPRRIQDFAADTTQRYDLIVSNPPFFTDHLEAQEPERNTARHATTLAHEELIAIAERLLSEHGVFYVLLPIIALEKFSGQCWRAGLCLRRQTAIRGFRQHRPKVAALTFGREEISAPVMETLTVYDAPGVYTTDAAHYLANFLLRFATPNQPGA